jgi:hypothetical protein
VVAPAAPSGSGTPVSGQPPSSTGAAAVSSGG